MRWVRTWGSKLNALIARHPAIGEVRGIGLFWGVELVKNRTTRSRLIPTKDKVSGVPSACRLKSPQNDEEGVFVQAWVSHFVIAPPLIITKEEIRCTQ